MNDSINIYGIAFQCPYIERCNNCSLKGQDHLSIREKIAWIGGLEEKDKCTIVQHHEICSKKRNYNLHTKVEVKGHNDQDKKFNL